LVFTFSPCSRRPVFFGTLATGEPGSAAGKPTSARFDFKPLKGLDPEAWESFCSHCEQDYPQFQLIFGVSDAADPASMWWASCKRNIPRLRLN